MPDIVYVLNNQSMPGLVKIGKTNQDDVRVRMSQLYTTGVPLPFECVLAIEVDDCTMVERSLHDAFGPSRFNPSREFFQIDEDQATAILQLLIDTGAAKDATPQVNAELNANVSQAERDASQYLRRPSLDFKEMDIPVGSILDFRDGCQQVEVISNKKVRYQGEEASLTAVTKELLGRDRSVRPVRFWTYEGKSLKKIYNETYGPA